MKRLWLLCLCLVLFAPAFAEAVAPAGEATLYVVVGEAIEQHPLAFEGEAPSVQELLDGLSALTGCNFDTDGIIHAGEDQLYITWASEASFLPGGEAPENVEFEEMLRCMLGSAWMTLRNNLGVRDIYFGTPEEAGLYFEDIHWLLPADDPYRGDFNAYYMDEDTPLGCAAAWRQTYDEPENGLSAEDALDIVFEKLLPMLEPTQGVGNWTVSPSGHSSADGLEGRMFEIDWSDSCDPFPSYRAILTDDGDIYLRKEGAKEYTLSGSWAE